MRSLNAMLLSVCIGLGMNLKAQGQELGSQRVMADPIAAGKTKFLGSVHSSSQIADFSEYWNQVTPENAGKWGSVERSRDQMSWADLDAAYKFAKDNGYPFKMHTLIWGSQQPTWIESLSATEQLEEINEWFSQVAERYPDIDLIDVVNEPIHAAPFGTGKGNYFNALGGTGVTGWDWVLESFRLARQYFPNSKLGINEYNILNSTGKASTYKSIVTLLQAEDLVDFIGLQGHAFTLNDASAESITNILDILATTDLPIYISELDLDGETDAVQLSRYKIVFPALWKHPSVQGITVWGFRPGLWRTDQKAYLIDTDGTERPALVWLRSFVESQPDDPSILSFREIRSLEVYPNPVTNGVITIETQRSISEIRIYALTGQRVKNLDAKEQDFRKVNLGLKSGIYLFQVLFEDGTMTNRRIKIE